MVILKYLILQLHSKEQFSDHKVGVVHAVDACKPDFRYTADVIQSSGNDVELVEALSKVTQPDTVVEETSSTGEREERMTEGWRIDNVRIISTAALMLGHAQPSDLRVDLPSQVETPPCLGDLLDVVAEKFTGRLELGLNNARDKFKNIDHLIMKLSNAK